MGFRKRLAASAAILALALAGSLSGPIVAEAQLTQQNAAYPLRAPNIRPFGEVLSLGSAYTNATTSFTATGLSVANTTVHDPSQLNSYNGTYVNEALHVVWTADVSKVTATTVTCELALNGNLIAASARTMNYAAGESTIGGYYDLYYASGNTLNTPVSGYFNVGVLNEVQTIAVYCKSGDTNTATVNTGSIYVEELY